MKIAQSHKPSQEELAKHGLFFCDDLLHMSVPTKEQMDKARKIQPRDFDDLHAMRLGTPKERIQARNRILTRHKRLVGYFAKRSIGLVDDIALEPDDLFTEGLIGFARALEKCDYTKGTKFITYCAYAIRQSIHRTIDNSGMVRVPANARQEIRRVLKMQRVISRDYGRKVYFYEASIKVGFSDLKSRRLQHVYNNVIKASQFRQHLRGDRMNDRDSNSHWAFRNSVSLADEKSPKTDEKTVDQELADQTARVLGTLTPLEEAVLRMRFGIGHKTDTTLEEVAEAFERTTERIRQIEAKALRKLRHPSRSHRLKPFKVNDCEVTYAEKPSTKEVPAHHTYMLTETDLMEAEAVAEIVEEYFSDRPDIDVKTACYFFLMEECAWPLQVLLAYEMRLNELHQISSTPGTRLYEVNTHLDMGRWRIRSDEIRIVGQIIQSELEELE